jgi:hypothetical protein
VFSGAPSSRLGHPHFGAIKKTGSGQYADWRQRLNEVGTILDHAPDLAQQVAGQSGAAVLRRGGGSRGTDRHDRRALADLPAGEGQTRALTRR